MPKKIVTLRIVVDMNSTEAKRCITPDHYFEKEVDTVIRKLSSISKHKFSKYSSEEGETEDGSKFKVMVKKLK